jgi:uncharacterized membrane protein YbhN (UPF0104 family)
LRGLRVALPWLAALALLALLFARVDAAATFDALRAGRLALYLPLACAFVGLWLAIDGCVLSALFSRVAGPVSWGRAMLLRAATYPVMALSFDLANAALLGLVRRHTSASLARVGGALLAHYLCDLLALSTLALAASLALDAPELRFLVPALALFAAVLAALLVASHLGRGALVGRPVVEVLAELAPREIAGLVASRAVFYLSFALFAWLTLPAFGVRVPPADVLARMPVVMGIGSLPIAAGGLGTTQAAMLLLFARFGPPANVLAYSIAYSATLLVLRMPVGFAAWLALRERPRPEGLA